MATVKTARKRNAGGQATPLRRARSTARRRTGSSRGASGVAIDPSGLFPRLASVRCDRGGGVLLAFARRDGDHIEGRYVRHESPVSSRKQVGNRRGGSTEEDRAALAGLFHGLGHPDRLAILEALALGAGTHGDLKSVVQLQAGPLYHHLHELERAGLVGCRSRNSYALTETGRSAFLAAGALEVWVSGSRPAGGWQRRRLRGRIRSGDAGQRSRVARKKKR
ncbi:MAG: ArsR/SmtB family transcription factor [Phycisphaerae bacterium]